jgi:hypothetical protein
VGSVNPKNVDAMIDIKKTIFTNIVDKINMLRYQAKDDPKAFKALLNIIIVDDIIEWSESLDTPHKVFEKLIEKRHALLTNNPCIKLQYSDFSTAYVNVNTAQSSDTWKRIWDASEKDTYITPIEGT